MTRLAALIFDVDGTLAETEELHRCAFNAAFETFALGWHWDVDLYTDLLRVTGGKERIESFVRSHHPHRMSEIAPRIAEIHARKTSLFAALMAAGGMAARPGIRRLIEEARDAGLKLAIATTTTRANVTALLRAMVPPLDAEAFEIIVAGDEVARKKPDPEVYEAVLLGLGLPASACVAIEDSRNGLLAAHATGIATIVTPSLFTAKETFGEALAVLSHLGEPLVPYRHLAGVGSDASAVTPDLIERWLAAEPADA